MIALFRLPVIWNCPKILTCIVSYQDMTIRSFGTESRMSRVSNISEVGHDSIHYSGAGSVFKAPLSTVFLYDVVA